jgi:hypothetical protein
VVYYFAVGDKPAVANGVKAAFFFAFVIDPCRQAVKNKKVMLFYVVNNTAFDIRVTFFYKWGGYVFRLKRGKFEFFEFVRFRAGA